MYSFFELYGLRDNELFILHTFDGSFEYILFETLDKSSYLHNFPLYMASATQFGFLETIMSGRPP